MGGGGGGLGNRGPGSYIHITAQFIACFVHPSCNSTHIQDNASKKLSAGRWQNVSFVLDSFGGASTHTDIFIDIHAPTHCKTAPKVDLGGASI